MLRPLRLLLCPYIFVGALFCALQSCNVIPKQGAATREELVTTYLDALENKDEQAILELIPKDYDAKQVVEEKIARLGDRDLEQVKITYQELQKPSSIKVSIEGLYDDDSLPSHQSQSKDQIFIHSANNRWYLILGQQKSAS